jgi:hypothetical protein
VEDTGDTGIIAHYTFEEGVGPVIDQSGNGHNLTVSGMTYDTEAAEGTYALYSNAREHKATAATDFFPPLGNFSFCMWYRVHSSAVAQPDFLSSRALGGLGAVKGINIGMFGGGEPRGMGLSMDDGSGNVVSRRDDDFFFTYSVWYSVVATVDRATNGLRFYRNGIDVTSSFTNEPTGTGSVIGVDLSGSPVVLGGRPGATNRGCYGRFDDIRVYDRILTAQEAVDYHNKVLPA